MNEEMSGRRGTLQHTLTFVDRGAGHPLRHRDEVLRADLSVLQVTVSATETRRDRETERETTRQTYEAGRQTGRHAQAYVRGAGRPTAKRSGAPERPVVPSRPRVCSSHRS